MRGYLRSHRPRVLVLENVEELVGGDGHNFGTLMCVLKELGYKATAMTLKSSEYRSPQRRVRVYIVWFFGTGRFTRHWRFHR